MIFLIIDNFIAELPDQRNKFLRLHFFHSVIHNQTAFQCYFYNQRIKQTKLRSLYPCHFRRYSMEPGKGLGKAFRRIIPIFIGGINDLLPCGKQVLSGQRQPAVPNIFVGCHTRHEAEGPVEIIARHVNLPAHFPASFPG